MDAVYPISPLLSREAKRAFEKETANYFNLFKEVNDSFLNQLFSDNSFLDYDILYQAHLDIWIKRCEWVYHKKPKYFYVDTHWFEREYKPQL